MASKWVFYETPAKRSLTDSEVVYWKTNLDRILKAGIEFEFNLPSNKGTCKGNLRLCPCIKLTPENNCWKKCGNEKECKAQQKENFKCDVIFCPNFINYCVVCQLKEFSCEQCKYLYLPEKDPDNIRDTLRTELEPSHNYGRINSSGVHSIVCDGSLLGSGNEGKGAEIITTGRRIDYWEFLKMNKSIINKALQKGAYINERCSIHVHLLASYYKDAKNRDANELEKPIPQIILSNFHQLCRKYQNALTWMTMTLNDPKYTTRWEKYRASILDISPIQKSMPTIIHFLEKKTGKVGGKYGWVNYMFMSFNSNCDITKFHLEMRVMDGNMSPSAVTAMTCLFYALIIKAIELSRYGLFEAGSQKELETAFELKQKLLNNNPEGWGAPHRFSENRLSVDDQHILINQSIDLLYQVKHILLKIGPVYDILEQLAYKPISYRRIEGKSWEEIEEELAVVVPKKSQIEKLVHNIIDTRLIIKCKDIQEWLQKTAELTVEEDPEATLETITQLFNSGKDSGSYIWSDNIGSVLKV